MILETSFILDDYDIVFEKYSSSMGDLEVVLKLYELLREYGLSKSFDYINYGAKLRVICRILFLDLIKVAGYTYSEL